MSDDDHKKLKLDTSDPKTRATWEAVQRAKAEVDSWPAWKRGDNPPDVVALSELSDEPTRSRHSAAFPDGWIDFSPRLSAVLDRLPANRVRIANALMNASVLTVGGLQALTDEQLQRMKGIGGKYITDIDKALAAFDLARKEHWIVVRANANPIEAHLQRLQRWIAERMAACERLADVAIFDHEQAVVETERAALADVMLILDGRAPSNKRRQGT